MSRKLKGCVGGYSQYLEGYLSHTRRELATPGAFLWRTLEGEARRWFWRYRASLVASLDRYPGAHRIVNRRGGACWVGDERYLELQLSFDRALVRNQRKPRVRDVRPIEERVNSALAILYRRKKYTYLWCYDREELLRAQEILRDVDWSIYDFRHVYARLWLSRDQRRVTAREVRERQVALETSHRGMGVDA